MLGLAIVATVALAASSQARATQLFTTELVSRAAAQPPTCSLVKPPPTGEICNKPGKVASSAFVGTSSVDACGPIFIGNNGAVENQQHCQAFCDKLPTCQSMSYNAVTGLCDLYIASVANQKFTTVKGGSNIFFDESCFTCNDTCFPNLINTGFNNHHICPWDTNTDANVGVSSNGANNSVGSLSVTTTPGDAGTYVFQPFTWCTSGQSYSISFSYMFLNNIPGSGLDVDYAGGQGTGETTTILDATNNPATTNMWSTFSTIVTPGLAGNMTFHVYTNPFFSASQTILIDEVNIALQA